MQLESAVMMASDIRVEAMVQGYIHKDGTIGEELPYPRELDNYQGLFAVAVVIVFVAIGG